MNVPSSWSATGGSPFKRRMLHESSNTNISIPRRFMCGQDFHIEVPYNSSCLEGSWQQQGMETFCLPPSSHSLGRHILMGTDCTRIVTPNSPVSTFKPYLRRTELIGGRAQQIAQIWTPFKCLGFNEEFPEGQAQAQSMPELKEGIRKFWVPQMCYRYIDPIQKVMPDVIKANRALSEH